MKRFFVTLRRTGKKKHNEKIFRLLAVAQNDEERGKGGGKKRMRKNENGEKGWISN